MTKEQFNDEFKKAGIEVTIYQDLCTGSEKLAINTHTHDKQIRENAIDKFVDSLTCQACFTNMQKDAIRIYAEQLKEENNG